jgi:branched-chain amino acid transport system substrate-binding protein
MGATAAAEDETPEADATPATDETPGAGTGAPAAGGALPNVGDIDVGNISIALQAPLSGPQSQFGTTARNGAQLAIQELAPQMGLDNLELVEFDDQAQEPVGASNASTIAANQDILCVDGHINSGVALAALPTYQAANLVMISPANTNPRITEEFDDTAYRLVGRDDVQGVVAADFAKNNLNAQNVYVLHDQTAYGEGLATVFRDRATELGMNVTDFAGTQETAVFDAVLTPIQAANPDVVFFGGIYDKAGPFVQQMRGRGIEATLLGGDGLDSPDLTRLGGEAAVGTNYVTVSGPASAYPEAAQFVEQYQQQFNQPAAYPAFQAYDAATACMIAIANAANEANGKPTREQVKAAMQELQPFTGVTGQVEFNDEGDRDPATYFIFEVASPDPAQWGQNEVVDEVEASPPEGE